MLLLANCNITNKNSVWFYCGGMWSVANQGRKMCIYSQAVPKNDNDVIYTYMCIYEFLAEVLFSNFYCQYNYVLNKILSNN